MQAIDEKIMAVSLETITNPQLQVVDIAEISKIAAASDISAVLDGTVTTPYLFRSKDFGVAVEVLSSTKYISCGATTVGGLIHRQRESGLEQMPGLKESGNEIRTICPHCPPPARGLQKSGRLHGPP